MKLFKGLSLKLLILIFALDQWFKKKQSSEFGDKEIHYPPLPKITLTYLKNEGFALGVMSNSKEKVEGIGIGFLLMTSLEYMKELFSKGNHLVKIGYGLILGGGLSNVFDRIQEGGVIDYIQLKEMKGKFKDIVFNLADVSIVIGVFIVMIGKIFSSKVKH